MPRYELGEAVGDRDDRLAEVVVGHAGGAPQRAGAGHVATMRGGPRPQLGHEHSLAPPRWSVGHDPGTAPAGRRPGRLPRVGTAISSPTGVPVHRGWSACGTVSACLCTLVSSPPR